MTVNPATQAAQLFASLYGAVVSGAPKALPMSTSGDIFTVVGGRVMVTSITGVVTTVIQTQACTISVGHKPSGGSSETATLAGATSIDAAAVGTGLSVIAASFPADVAVVAPSSLIPGTELGAIASLGGLALVPVGTIQVTTSATNTGDIQWTMTYLPYDIGAYVTAD